MMSIFRDKQIIILSPQSWNHIHVSKHHYAKELAILNKVYFISAPLTKFGWKYKWYSPEKNPNLEVLDFKIPLVNRIKFYWPALYRKIVKRRLFTILKERAGYANICIDFGCYAEFDTLKNFPAHFKIFFPVDDKNFITGDARCADMVLSVSKNITEKFLVQRKQCFYINHGLSNEFSEVSKKILATPIYIPNKPLCFGYAGNIFSTYLDFDIFEKIIRQNEDIRFILYGDTKFNAESPVHKKWYAFLKQSKNVELKGILKPIDLAKAYTGLDGFVLCYKPDYIHYHGENSHKILEYLSTGKIVISTHISIYEKSLLFSMSQRNHNEELINIFSNVIQKIEAYNSENLIKQRIEFALDNSYKRQIDRIEKMILKILSKQP